MAAAIVSYLAVGLLIGLVVRVTVGEETSLTRLVAGGGAGGLIGGVLANLIFSGGVGLDLPGWAGSAILAILVVLVMRVSASEDATT